MRTLGEAKANVALARSLLEVAYVLLQERRPYQEPEPKQMHELEKAKLVRHHAKRLRQLGADNELVEEVVARPESTRRIILSRERDSVAVAASTDP